MPGGTGGAPGRNSRTRGRGRRAQRKLRRQVGGGRQIPQPAPMPERGGETQIRKSHEQRSQAMSALFLRLQISPWPVLSTTAMDAPSAPKAP